MAAWLWLPGLAANLTREAEVAAEIRRTLAVDDEALSLTAAGTEFLGLYRAADRSDPIGATVMLHGRDKHPASQAPIGSLRRLLSNRGWHTLVVQMPLLSPTAPAADWLALDGEAVPRAAAAVTLVKQRKLGKVALIGHDTGANAALAFAATQPAKALTGLVLISPVAPRDPVPDADIAQLAASRVPVLLLAAGTDARAHLDYATQLGRRLRTGGAAVTERRIPGAGHDYRGQETLLGGIVRAWLHRVAQ